MSNLVEVRSGNVFTTSQIIAGGIGVDHEMVFKLITKYKDRKTFSTLKVEKISTKGRPALVYYLTESQASFLITLMRNSDIVLDFKERLVSEFYKQRKTIEALKNQRNDAEWKQQRADGKVRYMQKTNVIKQFADYATAQGSKNAERYYANFAKMENSALFFIEQKYPNLRDVLNLRQLMLVAVADDVIEKALKDGMMQSMHYKECYQLAKERVVAFASIVGKSPIEALLDNSINGGL